MDTAAAAAAAAGEDVASSLCGDYKRHLPSPHPPAVAPRLLLVRHGERADEVRGVSISEADRDLPYYDPPLTQRGHLQAADAGKRLSRVAGIAQARIFASPTIRTVETVLVKPICTSPAPRRLWRHAHSPPRARRVLLVIGRAGQEVRSCEVDKRR